MAEFAIVSARMQSPTLNWRASVVESPRGFLVTLTNSTTVTMTRKAAQLTNGTWGVMPPEVRKRCLLFFFV